MVIFNIKWPFLPRNSYHIYTSRESECQNSNFIFKPLLPFQSRVVDSFLFKLLFKFSMIVYIMRRFLPKMLTNNNDKTMITKWIWWLHNNMISIVMRLDFGHIFFCISVHIPNLICIIHQWINLFSIFNGIIDVNRNNLYFQDSLSFNGRFFFFVSLIETNTIQWGSWTKLKRSPWITFAAYWMNIRMRI